MNKNNRNLLSIGFLAILILSGCSISLAGDVTPPPGYQPPVYEEPEILTGAAPQVVPNPTRGAAIYAEKCEACHGISGLGDGPDSTSLPNEVARIGAPNVANIASPLGWYSVILQGNIERFMPPFSGSLTPEDVWDVMAYTFTFSADPETVSTGSQVFADTCASCHGPEGSGGGIPGAADLLDSERMVLLSVDDIVQKIATGSGNDDHVFSTELDAGQIEAAALYVRSLIFPLEGEVVALETTPEPASETGEETAEKPGDEQGEESAEDTDQGDTETSPHEGIFDNLGTITGTVVNGSGGELPGDLEVRLEVYEAFELAYEQTVAVEADGSYVFEDVSIDPDLIYITLVELDGMFFPSEFHMGGDIVEDTIDLPITIYDASSDPSNLAVSRLHVFFEVTGEETLQVIHQVTISNRGTTLVAPQDQTEPVLKFSLPDEAIGLIFQNGTLGNPYLQTNSGFADPSPVLPGEGTYEVLYADEMPFTNKLDWQLPVDFPTDVAVIFVSGDTFNVESQSLRFDGVQTLGEDVFQVFLADNLNTSQSFDLSITKPFFGGGGGWLQENWLTIILGAAGLALAIYGAWSFFAPAPVKDLDEDDQDALVDSILALDEAYEAGDLDEDEYLSSRDALKAQLKELLDGEND